jgi:hypothetical protein
MLQEAMKKASAIAAQIEMRFMILEPPALVGETALLSWLPISSTVGPIDPGPGLGSRFTNITARWTSL